MSDKAPKRIRLRGRGKKSEAEGGRAAPDSAEQFYIDIGSKLYYSTKDPVPISDIIESLAGIEKLARLSPAALQLLTGIAIDHVEVFVDHIESGSLLEESFIRFFFKDRAGLDAFIDKLRLTVGDGPVKSLLLTALLLAFVTYGAYTLAQSQGGGAITITASENAVINIGSGVIGVTPEQFKAAVEAAVTDKKALATATTQVLKPARADAAATLTFDDNPALVFPADAVAETPTRFEVQPDHITESYVDTELHIRNTNRDNPQSGWLARLPVRFDRKLPLQIAEGIDHETIASMAMVKGDVDVVMRLRADTKRYEPHHLVLRKLSTN